MEFIMEKMLKNPISEILNKSLSWKNAVKSALSKNRSQNVLLEGLSGALPAFFSASLLQEHFFERLRAIQYGEKCENVSDTIIVVQGDKDAMELQSDLGVILGESAEIFVLPWWGTVPYRPVAKGAAVFGERSSVLSSLCRASKNMTADEKPRIFIMSQRAFLTPVPPPEYTKNLSFRLTNGQTIDTSQIAEKLIALGYMRVPRVTVSGEFALRGEVLDIFPAGSSRAVRCMFDFDEIERIKYFDVATQNTSESADFVLIGAMKEVIWTAESAETAEKKLLEIHKNGIGGSEEAENAVLSFTDVALSALDVMIGELGVNGETSGEELFYPLLWEKPYSVLDYLDESATVIFADFDRLSNAEENLWREYRGMYRKARLTLPVLPPEKMIFSFETLSEISKNRIGNILFKSLHTEISDENAENTIKIESENARSFFGNINYLKEQLSLLQNDGWRIFIFGDNASQALRISELLKDFQLEIIGEPISAGFSLPEEKLLVIAENEIFARKKAVPHQVRKNVKSSVIDTFVELNPGDYVVHVNYGIGLFKGIERVKTTASERDYITIEYADEDFVYVPIEQVNMVQRYIGSEGDKPRLDKIGSKSWENRKNRVQKSVEELAEKLIDLYSRRKASAGFPFPRDTEWQTAFEASFPYEDTADQAAVTEEIKADMEKSTPMDRLICGDVGYGKTEIALRAAFKAVMGGKQVAFLAPTTILAEQHYETCIERFANFPVKIAQLSRFVTSGEQKKILRDLAAGQVDIIVQDYPKRRDFSRFGLDDYRRRTALWRERQGKAQGAKK